MDGEIVLAVWRFVAKFFDLWGHGPTCNEISVGCSVSTATAGKALDILEAQGAIHCEWGPSRRRPGRMKLLKRPPER